MRIAPSRNIYGMVKKSKGILLTRFNGFYTDCGSPLKREVRFLDSARNDKRWDFRWFLLGPKIVSVVYHLLFHFRHFAVFVLLVSQLWNETRFPDCFLDGS